MPELVLSEENLNNCRNTNESDIETIFSRDYSPITQIERFNNEYLHFGKNRKLSLKSERNTIRTNLAS